MEPHRSSVSREDRSVEIVELSTGAAMRVTGTGRRAVVCVNGGQGAEVPGTWSATLEWLVRRLAHGFPELRFGEVRYRIKSWKRLDMCIDDARAAIEQLGGKRTLMLGFSMGGAVSIAAADRPDVEGVLGLGPWIPDRLEVSPLQGKRLVVIHGGLDRWLPGIPGVSPASSRRGFERALAAGAQGSYMTIPGAVHGTALRTPSGAVLPLPRAHRWAELVGKELARFESSG
jgi:pimeloyl-ACP methyl ester carboxylesterase